MKVSFIIPLYNCLAHTQVCLRTLQASLPRDLEHEIIFVDDGSTDSTRDWLANECRKHVVILNEKNLGYAGANNRGAAQATGDLLVLINNDLIFSPGWLEPMLALHQKLSRPGLIGNVQRDARTGTLDHTGIFFDHKGKAAHDRTFPLPSFLFAGYRTSPAVTGACMLVSTALWRQLGGFDAGYRNGGEDIDLCLRAQHLGHINAVALRSSVRHHISASPGRKLNDEQNSRRLTQRWRKEIERLSTRAWGWHFLSAHWGSASEPTNPIEALATLLYCLHLRATPPTTITNGIAASLDHELARWDRLFPG